MNPNSPAGHAARIGTLESAQAEIFKRLQGVETTTTRIETKLDDDRRYFATELGHVRDDCADVARWVKERDAARERDERRRESESLEKRKLRSGEKVAIIGAIALVICALITTIASLAAAGVFG